MYSHDMTYCLVSNRDQVYTVNLNEIPKTEVIPNKVSICSWQIYLHSLRTWVMSLSPRYLKYWFCLVDTETDMAIKTTGSRKLCYEREA